jgi:transcriptional repressor NrdR
MELMDCTVVKRNGRREPYSREKLEVGIRRSLQKRPFTQVQFHALIHTIEREIQKTRSGEITSAEIGEIVMTQLKKFDSVAYIRFASVYRSFEDIEMFEQEVKKLGERSKKENG